MSYSDLTERRVKPLLIFKVDLPPNLGNITRAQFDENYHELARYGK